MQVVRNYMRASSWTKCPLEDKYFGMIKKKTVAGIVEKELPIYEDKCVSVVKRKH